MFGQTALGNFELNAIKHFFSLLYNFLEPLICTTTTRLFVDTCQYINILHAGDPMVGKTRNNPYSHVAFSPLKGDQHPFNDHVN